MKSTAFKMSCTGLSKPYAARYNPETGAYSDGFKMGKATTFGVTANYANATLAGDNETAESEESFTNASITAGSTYWPIEAASVVFNHTVATDGEVKFGSETPNAIGYGVVQDGKANGVKCFSADILTNAVLRESAESYTTRGDSVEYVTPALEGTAIADKNGLWRRRKNFETLAEAEAWIKEVLNISEDSDNSTGGGSDPSDTDDGV